MKTFVHNNKLSSTSREDNFKIDFNIQSSNQLDLLLLINKI